MNDTHTSSETLASLEAQLVSLYAEREEQGNVQEMRAMVASLEAQLCDLYANREAASASDSEAIRSLEAQVIGLTDEKMQLERKLVEMENDVRRLKAKARVMGAALFEAALFNAAPVGL